MSHPCTWSCSLSLQKSKQQAFYDTRIGQDWIFLISTFPKFLSFYDYQLSFFMVLETKDMFTYVLYSTLSAASHEAVTIPTTFYCTLEIWKNNFPLIKVYSSHYSQFSLLYLTLILHVAFLLLFNGKCNCTPVYLTNFTKLAYSFLTIGRLTSVLEHFIFNNVLKYRTFVCMPSFPFHSKIRPAF